VLRQNKQIGNSLQAKVTVTAAGGDLALLKQYQSQLPMLFIVSEVDVEPGEFGVRVDRASGVKCERCWRYVPKVSGADGQGICERCEDALAEAVSS
jgi:isoleucyl-tRNA synthetase